MEEAGETATRVDRATGNNPRKGTTHTVCEVGTELADVAFTALVAIESLGLDHRQVMSDCAAKVGDRIVSVH